MSEETNKTTINTSQQIHKISDNIPAVNKITEGIYGNTVSDHVKRVRDAFSRKMQYWNSDTNAAKDFKNTRKERSRSSNHFGIRLEGLVIKEGILPELSEDDITMNMMIGQGAYGDVYEATLRDREARTYRHVAVKTLKCTRVENVAAFLRELHMLRACGKHPHIIQFYGALTSNTALPKVVLQLCAKGDLFSLISKCKPCHDKKYVYGFVDSNTTLTFRDVFKILRDTAKGLDHLHSKGVIHRDVSARNVLLNDSFTPKISDFGLSSHHVDVTANHKISQGVSIPTRWAAPELVIGKCYSYKSDVWSLGMLIGEVISYGDVPWPRHTEIDIRRAMERRRSPDPPHNSYYTLQLLILQCWEYEPSRRPELSNLAESIWKIDVLSS